MELITCLLEQYTHQYKHCEEQVIFFLFCSYEGGPKSNRKHFLVGGPVVVHASAARYLLRGPFCISLPTGIVE